MFDHEQNILSLAGTTNQRGVASAQKLARALALTISGSLTARYRGISRYRRQPDSVRSQADFRGLSRYTAA